MLSLAFFVLTQIGPLEPRAFVKDGRLVQVQVRWRNFALIEGKLYRLMPSPGK
jgi:hypothetical protein